MWLMPTISRPNQCAEILDRITSSGCATPGVVFINGESHAEEYKEKLTLPSGWKAIICDENIGCIGALNKMFEMFPDEPWYGFLADDEYLEDAPRDWDLKLIEKAGSWDISHGYENLNNGGRAQGYVCIGGDIVRSVGYLGVKECFHNYGFDCLWEWLGGIPIFGGGGMLRIFCIPEIKIDHRHVIRNRSENDSCYQLANSHFEQDRNRFVDWTRIEMPKVIERIKKAKELAGVMA